MTRSRSITVKIKQGLEIQDLLSTIEGVLRSTPLFPGETDPDLACLFQVELDPSQASDIQAALEASPLVDYIEEPSTRRLIRGRPSTRDR